MVSPTASASDVRELIDTELSDTDIDNYLDDAAFLADDAISNYSNDISTSKKTFLEKHLAALNIRLSKDRAASSVSRETASVSYEGMSISQLRENINKVDPSGKLASNMDTSRYVNSGP